MSKDDYDHMVTLVDTDADRLDAKLRLVLGTIPSMVVITDRNLNIRRANRAWCNFADMNESDLIGKNLLEMTGSTNGQYICTRAMNVMESGKEESFELTSNFRPGRLISFTIRPWPQGVALFSYDRTEEARAAERHMRDLAFDTAMAEVGGFGFGSLDMSGRISFPTKSLANLLGADAQGLQNILLETVLSPESRAKLREVLQASDFKKTTFEIEFLQGGKDFNPGEMAIVPYSSVNGLESLAFVIRAKSPPVH